MIEGINMISNNIQPITNNIQPIKNEIVYPMDDSSFKLSLDAAKELLNSTIDAEKETEKLTFEFMTGQNDNVHELMIAQEKSSILLQFTMQVRNGVMTAYQEIMKIPV
ncbi:hypothetical protein AN639_08960 [Candidatus Epulonipiscium fishelsonii]|uniref:Uncharacterized protein n=1 Tax=Candidatus Epulonipiscium fishelsonii TaxID=77094 RepID=A0ACC8XDK4_9FIRM|nr:hypothetical protein AN639_08960 [Epulopiscium sp. SCG-B05WGA-EpuloA1]ONI40975.1 hypothetical protein AN396_04245 [Epulopiscium sp. SCG-B11WGA-EpuloA1]